MLFICSTSNTKGFISNKPKTNYKINIWIQKIQYLPKIIISLKVYSFFIPYPKAMPNRPNPSITIKPWNGPAKKLTNIPDMIVAITANFKLCRKVKMIIGRGHKKLTTVPNKGIYMLITNNTAVIAAKKSTFNYWFCRNMLLWQ